MLARCRNKKAAGFGELPKADGFLLRSTMIEVSIDFATHSISFLMSVFHEWIAITLLVRGLK